MRTLVVAGLRAILLMLKAAVGTALMLDAAHLSQRWMTHQNASLVPNPCFRHRLQTCPVAGR